MTYSIISWIKLGFKSSFRNYFRLLLVAISYNLVFIVAAIAISVPILNGSVTDTSLLHSLCLLTVIILFILLPGITVGQTKAILNIARNERCHLLRCYLSYIKPHRLIKAWGFFFVYIAMIGTGLILGIIPGIYLYSVWFVAVYILIEKNESVLNCFVKSRQLIKKAGILRLIGLGVLMFAIIIILSIFSIPLVYLIDFIIMSNGIELPYSDIGTIASYIVPILIAPIQYMVSAHVYLSLADEYVESPPQKTMKTS